LLKYLNFSYLFFQKRKLGPGYYDLVSEKEKPHSKIGIIGQLSERFSDKDINRNPG
jgi:hypothetical protein